MSILYHIKIFLIWLFYRFYKLSDYNRYLAAKLKGYYCEDIKNGIAKFDRSRPPQEKPEILSFKQFRDRVIEVQNHRLINKSKSDTVALKHSLDKDTLLMWSEMRARYEDREIISDSDIEWGIRIMGISENKN